MLLLAVGYIIMPKHSNINAHRAHLAMFQSRQSTAIATPTAPTLPCSSLKIASIERIPAPLVCLYTTKNR